MDEYQLLEARANGADTVLLIVAILELDLLDDLIYAARELKMEPLVEVGKRLLHAVCSALRRRFMSRELVDATGLWWDYVCCEIHHHVALTFWVVKRALICTRG